ncbi:hypothetical protein PILCRDRAFT_814340 [Piloderma croceum F 1598]|uniref:Zn(2)-C6 fungal-type domain-containing protein n=1 Tax=Piloderma croceum (strain F 1598) TaxID=765440 RepID=A0A0C3CFB8_PILCF|nr:hypothetical protein PILCRDRAFT_814340 [Piloderma croceum F 1598]
MSQHPADSPYSYPPPQQPAYATSSTTQMHLAHQDPSALPMSSAQMQSDRRGGESEHDGDEQPGPPKKKRRRQALSCTECKRRKIKCDRQQPCGPCSRRNEQAKCQWHIVEPIEKYVTRAEYDELKARFEQLEQTVSSLFRPPAPSAPPPPTAATNTGNVPPQYYQMSMSGGMPGGGGGGPPTNLPSYNPQPHQQSGMYPMLPPGSFIPSTQPLHHRYPGPDSPRTATSPRHMSMQQQQQQQHSPATSPVIQTAPSPSRNPKSPQSAKNSPLSLASITTPYNTTNPNPNTTSTSTTGGGGGESQSKNYQRRRTLGVRLRLVTPHEDPVVRCNGAPRWRHPQRAHKNLWLGARVILVVCRFRDNNSSNNSILGGLVMLLHL